MAVAHLGVLGSAQSATSGTTLPITLTAGAAVGDTVCVAFLASIGTGTTWSCTDSKGNTWSQSTPRYEAAQAGIIVFYSKLTTALVSGDTITPAISAAATHRVGIVNGFSGVNAYVADVGAVSGGNSSAAPTSPGTTINTGQLGYGLTGWSVATGTPTAASPWTTPTIVRSAGRSLLSHYQIATSSGSVAHTVTSPGTVRWSDSCVVFSEASAGGPQSLTVPLLDGSAALYAPTLTPKNLLTVPLLDGGAALYAPTLTVGPRTLTLPLLDGGAALYAPTIALAGGPAQSLTIPLLDGAATLFAPTVTPTNLLTVPLLDGGAALYAPTLAPKSLVTLGLLDAGATLYAPSLTPKTTTTLPLLDAGALLYAPTITVGPRTLTIPLLDGAAALYAPTVQQVAGGSKSLTIPLLDGGAALYAPTLTVGPRTLTIPLLNGAAALYAPTFVQTSTTALPLLDAGAALYAPTLTQVQGVVLPLLDGGAALYAPTLFSIYVAEPPDWNTKTRPLTRSTQVAKF